MNYKVWDIVIVRENLIPDRYYGWVYFNYKMKDCIGLRFTISYIFPSWDYQLWTNTWTRSDEMLIPGDPIFKFLKPKDVKNN